MYTDKGYAYIKKSMLWYIFPALSIEFSMSRNYMFLFWLVNSFAGVIHFCNKGLENRERKLGPP